MIRFKNVCKSYGQMQVLSEINLEIRKGELVALIGPSGCGKTTTLRMINRLIEPSSGKIFIDNQDISQLNPVELRRNIGYVIQQIGLLPHMTIGKNIGIVPKLKGWKEKEYSNRIDELLDMVGLDPKVYRNRYPSQLSGGQQQRIGVIRALAAEPPVILMDEPFSALDPISREQLQDELVRLQKEIHKTIVFVTHDIDEALKISDRIAILNAGRLVQFDSPANILKQPANDFVRDFIGEKRIWTSQAAAAAYGVRHVEDVMIRPPVTLHTRQTITEALTAARDSEEEAFLVLDEKHEVAGIVSLIELERNAGRGDEPVLHVLQKPAAFLESTSDWQEAARLLESKTYGVPVTKQGRVVGLVTRSSLLRHLSKVSV